MALHTYRLTDLDSNQTADIAIAVADQDTPASVKAQLLHSGKILKTFDKWINADRVTISQLS
jgi:hypothetical protein